MADEPPILLGDPNVPDVVPPIGTITISETDLLDAIGAFIRMALGNIPMAKTQANRVPQFKVANYIMVTPSMRAQLATSVDADLPHNNVTMVTQSIRADVQFDVYGPKATDNVQAVVMLLRNAYGVRAFAGTGVSPLYCDDGRQLPLINGEKQYEDRWTFNASFQITPAVSTPAQFADTVHATLIEAD